MREDTVAIHDDIMPAMLISSGLELEAQQYMFPPIQFQVTYLTCLYRIQLKYDSGKLDASATMLQLAKMQERKNSHHRKVKAWVVIQHLYMPEVSAMHARADRAASDRTAETPSFNFPLHLPSSLPPRTRCLPKLQEHEFKLHEAQAYEALEELRQELRLRTHMYKYKNKNVVGQRANTRCQNLIHTVQVRVDACATKYNTARAALQKLSRWVYSTEWQSRLLPLAQEDIRPLMEGEEGQSEGHKKLSWIWKVVGVGDNSDNEGVQEGKFCMLVHLADLISAPY